MFTRVGSEDPRTAMLARVALPVRLFANVTPSVAKTSFEDSPVAVRTISQWGFRQLWNKYGVLHPSPARLQQCVRDGGPRGPTKVSVSWETSLVGLNWTWGQKLSSGLMLVPFMTTHFFQFHFADTQRYRHPSWCFNIQLLLPLHLLIHLETRESLNTRGAEGPMAATSHHSDDMMAKSSNSHGPSGSSGENIVFGIYCVDEFRRCLILLHSVFFVISN